MHPFVALMRRYVVDYLLRQDTEVCAQIMEPDYVLHMGGTDLGPRDDVYVPAVARQLAQFPGLGMTVHELVFTEDRLAMRFSQHGASVRHEGREAAWGGIGLYRWNGARLTSNYAIEDYYSRRVQLAAGVPCAVEAPAVAPWDARPGVLDIAAENAVRAWLVSATPGVGDRVIVDDAGPGNAASVLTVDETVIDELFSASGRVAFHVTQRGGYAGGLDLPEHCVGRASTLCSVGVVSRDADGVWTGRVIRERAALRAMLAD